MDKRLLLLVGAVVIFIIIITILNGSGNKEPKNPESAFIQEAPKFTDAENRKLDSLFQFFNASHDEFENKTWYKHKEFDKYKDLCRIIVHVKNDGYYYLESIYLAFDWINHTSISVKISDSIINSFRIPTYNSNNVRDVLSDGIVRESISYIGIYHDIDIVPFISRHKNLPMTIRFNGSHEHYDTEFKSIYCQAIADSYTLSNLLTLKNKYNKK